MSNENRTSRNDSKNNESKNCGSSKNCGNNKKAKSCGSSKSKACKASGSDSNDESDSSRSDKPKQRSPLGESVDKTEADVDKEQKKANESYAETIPQENMIFPDIVPNTTYTGRVTPIVTPPTSSSAKSGAAAKTAKYEDDGSIGGIVALLLIAAFIVFIIIVSASSGSTAMAQSGTIGGETNVRYGKTSVLTYDTQTADIKPYEQVVWYVGDKEVQRKSFSDDGALNFEFDGENLGSQKVRVIAGGRVFSETEVNVAKPSLNVKVADSTAYYGDEIKLPEYSADGFVDGDSTDNYQKGKVFYTAYGTKDEISPAKVGMYRARVNHSFDNKDYDVNVSDGTLQVLPRELVVMGGGTKIYDGTCVIENPKLKLLGVLEGDDVCVECDKLYLTDKNVGMHTEAVTSTIYLTGKDAKNYTIGEYDIKVRVMPLQINVSDMVAESKIYDGTRIVTFGNTGKLNGIIDGDVVEVGDIMAYFEDEKVGKNKSVIVRNVELVGPDSQNYQVGSYPSVKGAIDRKSTLD